jgi:hypothetical protein
MRSRRDTDHVGGATVDHPDPGDEVGDEMTVAHGEVSVASAVVRSIELHSPPGKTTIAVDADPADALRAGTVLTSVLRNRQS